MAVLDLVLPGPAALPPSGDVTGLSVSRQPSYGEFRGDAEVSIFVHFPTQLSFVRVFAQFAK